MVGKVLREYPAMDLETNDLDRIRKVSGPTARVGDNLLPAALEKASPTGCAALTWHEKPVAMICFNSGKNGSPKNAGPFPFCNRPIRRAECAGNQLTANSLGSRSWPPPVGALRQKLRSRRALGTNSSFANT